MNIRILFVEDETDHADLIMDCVQAAFQGAAQIDWHTHLETALVKLKEEKFDMCLIDLRLPDSPLDQTIEALENTKSATPFVILTSHENDEVAEKMIKEGVQDYLPKNELTPRLLYRTCVYAIERKRKTVDLEIKNRDQQMLCQSLSHDFRTPISQIASSSECLRKGLEAKGFLSEQETEYFEIINKNIASINELSDALFSYLNLSKKIDNFEKVNLNKLLDQIVAGVTRKLATDVDIHIAPLPSIQANRNQLLILFTNLLDNATKHNDKKPRVTITSIANHRDRYCYISIRDNGIGIEKKYLETIFDPFQKLHAASELSGTGLGLSLAKRVVDNHNGTIGVESTQGVGSTFTVGLPFVQI